MNPTTRIVGYIGVALLIGSATSHAQDWRNNLYLHTDLGPSFIPAATAHFNGFNPGGQFKGTGKFQADPGIRGDLALGLNLTKSWAVELEACVIWNPGPSRADCLYQMPLLVNAIYQVNLSDHWKAYLGAGGGAITSISQGFVDVSPFFTPIRVEDTTTSLGAQGQAGIKYSISKHFDVDLGYKLLWVDHSTYHYEVFLLGFQSNVRVNDLLTHSAQLSLTWKF